MLSALGCSVQRALVMIGTVYLMIAVAVVIVLGIASFLFARSGVQFRRFRRQRQVLCPDTGDFVVIHINAIKAAISSLGGDPKLRVTHCTNWPERHGCRQECLRAIGS